MKNKHYFIRIAILKTMFTGFLYLMMPLGASIYNKYIPDDYWGYTAFGAGIMILGNLILLIRSWAIALDYETRQEYLKER